MKGLSFPGYKGWRKQGLKTFLSLQEPPSGLIWAQLIEDYWLHQVSQAKCRGTHQWWIYTKVFNSEMNLQVPGDISKPDIVSVWKKQRYQMIRTALLVNISSLRIPQFLIVSDYRFWLEPHMTGQLHSILLYQQHNNLNSPLLWISTTSKYMTTFLKICSVLTWVFEEQCRFFYTAPSWAYLLRLFHLLDRTKFLWQIIWLDSFAN